MSNHGTEIFDCIIIGGGPAGLLAATYLARFRRKVLVADAGDGRALRIPRINNCPGFPIGISGRELVSRMRQQAARYQAGFIDHPVERIECTDQGFAALCGSRMLRTKRLLLATGVVDLAPNLPEMDRNIERRALCLCPVCDGYEAIDRKIGVIGCDEHALREAIFLRTYSNQISILMNDPDHIPTELRAKADRMGIVIVDTVDDIVSGPAGYEVILRTGAKVAFDVIYPALGCDVRSELAGALNALRDDDGHIGVDHEQQTSVLGIYAAGDVVRSLNQIAVAMGQAATAATAIHNSLEPNPAT
jgi:thioredoxin reductase (NADPH)